MIRSRFPLLACVLLLLAAGSLFAHHSFTAQFDRNQPVSFKGVVTKVEWMNPHVWFYVDAKDEKGNAMHWECEAANPNLLARRGWKKNTVKEGDQLTVEGFRARCCSNVMNAITIVFADGRKINAGSAER